MELADGRAESTQDQPVRREKCLDCLECQICISSRCRLCKKEGHQNGFSELGPLITHGEYMKWKRKKIECA